MNQETKLILAGLRALISAQVTLCDNRAAAAVEFAKDHHDERVRTGKYGEASVWRQAADVLRRIIAEIPQ